MEVPIDEDDCLEVETLSAQFPGACGLKYRSSDTGLLRGLRVANGKIIPPDEAWLDAVYIVVFQKADKRKGDDSNASSKFPRIELKCTDLICLGLPYSSTEEDVRTYFSKFGDVGMVQVKTDRDSGKSKGFGFVRFVEYESQRNCLREKHVLEGRRFEVKISGSKGEEGKPMSNKIFVGRMSEDITAEDLREYFSQFGEITDTYIPKPFRGFGFVTFADPYVVKEIINENFIINSTNVNVTIATPKPEKDNPSRKGSSQGGWGDGPSRNDGPRSRNDGPRSRNEGNGNDNDMSFNPSMLAAFGQALMSSMASQFDNNQGNTFTESKFNSNQGYRR